jgi:hypothetical protein
VPERVEKDGAPVTLAFRGQREVLAKGQPDLEGPRNWSEAICPAPADVISTSLG